MKVAGGDKKRAGAQVPDAFKIGDFDTKSTISWALEKCSEYKDRFCYKMAENGNLDLLKLLRVKGCPWHPYKLLPKMVTSSV